MTAASFRLKYAIASYRVVLLAAGAVAVLFMARYAADARSLSSLAERAARERIDPELEARAQGLAAHAATTIAGAVRARDLEGIARRLQPFTDDATVQAITVTARGGQRIFDWHRDVTLPPATLTAQAAAKVATYAETIPGAATPETIAMLSVTLRPRVRFSGAQVPSHEEIRQLHERAHEECFIANSVTTSVHIEPVFDE